MKNSNRFDKLRMVQWLLLSVLAYVLATALAGIPTGIEPEAGLWPRLQTILWKCGHLNLAAYIGYWIDRRAFHTLRITRSSHPTEQVRRAIIIGATMLAFGMAL
ncbi:hypothetical protein [Herbaspirillum sp. ST 5-3]|uniref:hypothetical protein n=1 Tax=Oxalobacteraceae TaxID=75682 RepID=UPI00145613BB|nr:hypothetical protein [Herbaspirillum sp. ST 5-3]